MTLRDEVWSETIDLICEEGEFAISDLPFDDSQRHTVRRVLREMESLGWVYRESKHAKTWMAGERARERFVFSDAADARLRLADIEREEEEGNA